MSIEADAHLEPTTDPPERSDAERWSWILLLIDAAEQAGLTPIDAARLHRLAFFANCLSPVYDLPEEDGKITKHSRGPHYAELQWDLDRLYVMGKVEMRSFTPFEDRTGWWFTASYALSPSTLGEMSYFRRSPRLARIHDFQVELAFAYADLPDETQVALVERDATYGQTTAADGDVIDFAEWNRQNFSYARAKAVSDFVPRDFPLGSRDRLHLYLRYLSRLAGGSGEGGDPRATRVAG
jgi:hypothetical protein